jgi:hypothetical protein
MDKKAKRKERLSKLSSAIGKAKRKKEVDRSKKIKERKRERIVRAFVAGDDHPDFVGQRVGLATVEEGLIDQQVSKQEVLGRTGTDMAKQTRFEILENEAKAAGLDVTSYSPGDGVTRYRFYPAGSGNNYFGPGDGIATVLGLKAAKDFIAAYAAGRSK